jgi:glycosyltransferase involved in cell wall biosynthesis
MLHVLHTIASLAPRFGGTSRALADLCGKLATKGTKVSLVTQQCGAPGDESALPVTEQVSLHLVKAFPIERLRILYAPGFEKMVIDLCREQGVHVIHDNGIWLASNRSSASAARSLGVPFVVSPHGMLEPWALSQRAWGKNLAWRFYQKHDLMSAHLLHATSCQEARHLRAAGLSQPIAVIPNGIELPSYPAKLNDRDGIKTALFLSRLHPKKGLLNLVEGWSVVRPKNWRIIIAGPNEGNHRQKIERAIAESKLSDVFTFVGFVDGAAKADLYSRADLFVLPTFSENFGIVVAEALAYGIPVITTKGSPWEVLVEHKCGWWIDIGVEPLIEALRQATSLDAVTLLAMGSRGRKLVEELFSMSNTAGQMVEVYEWILGGGPPPACVITD